MFRGWGEDPVVLLVIVTMIVVAIAAIIVVLPCCLSQGLDVSGRLCAALVKNRKSWRRRRM